MKTWLKNCILDRKRSTSQANRRGQRTQLIPEQRFIESLESRTLLTGVDCIQANLAIFVDSQSIEIPANIGVENGTQLSQIHTDADGRLSVAPIGTEAREDRTLGDFFETWRTNAGDAGNDPDATFDSDQLLKNLTDGSNSLVMLVNGQVNTEFESYVVQDGDEIILTLGANPIISINTNFGPMVLELFETETPGTVENFLNYVNDSDYANSIIHRSVNDFVIQGGGFTTSSETFTDTSQFTSVPTDPTIQNEPGISNLRGTVAMAKLGGNPDSASSQWFVNLTDNSFLDLPQNNAFTVFGQVLDLTTVDTIAALPINSEGGVFDELPYDNSNTLAVVETVTGNATLTGTVFFDTNGNDAFDGNETGRSDVTVYIDANTNGALDSGETTSTTDADGRYRFSVAPGNYDIRAILTNSEEGLSAAAGIGESVTLDFAEESITAPTSVALANDSDTGSPADNRTSLNNSSDDQTLDVLVTGTISGATVSVLANGNVIGTGVATSESLVVTTDGSTTISDGDVQLTAVQVLQSVPSGESPALSVTIDSVAPVAAVDEYTVQEDNPLTIDAAAGVLANDTDANTLSATFVDTPIGTLTGRPDGSFDYTPPNDFNGTDSFTYRAVDGAGESELITVTITVEAVNDQPVAAEDSYNAIEDTVFTSGNSVLDNDTDVDGDALTAAIATNPANGVLDLNEDGTFTYTPAADFSGIDSFSYTSFDGIDNSSAVTVTIVVGDTADPPDAEDDSLTVTLETEQRLSVLQNDSDVDSSSFVIDSVSNSAVGATIAVSDDGSTILYTPPVDGTFTGDDTFTYTIRDSDGLTDSATVTTTLSPLVTNSSISGSVYSDTNENGMRDADESGIPGAYVLLREETDTGNNVVSSYLTDADGNWEFTNLGAGTYSVTQTQPSAFTDGDESSGNPSVSVEEDQFANIVLNGVVGMDDLHFGESSISGDLIHLGWFFASNFRGESSAERDAVAQGEENAGQTILAEQIRSGQNAFDRDLLSAPSATNDTYSVEQNQPLNIDTAAGLLNNDVDPEGQELTASEESGPANGVLTLNEDGAFTYEPNADFSGTDSFSYRVTDEDGNSDIGTVNINVAAAINSFSILEGVANGTSIGTVTAPDSLGQDVLFQIEQEGVREELEIRADDQISGSETASIVLIEYLDFRCPACAAIHDEVQAISAQFEGDIMVVSRNLLTASGTDRQAAVAAEAMSNQGLYDEMADQLFTNQTDWAGLADPTSLIEEYVVEIGGNLDQFRADINDTAIQAKIDRDFASAASLNATVTPTFFLQGQQIDTPVTLADFAAEIQSAIDDLEQPFTINRSTGELLVLDTTEISADVTPTISFNVFGTDTPGSRELIEVNVSVAIAGGGSGSGSASASAAASPGVDNVFSEFGDLLTVER